MLVCRLQYAQFQILLASVWLESTGLHTRAVHSNVGVYTTVRTAPIFSS